MDSIKVEKKGNEDLRKLGVFDWPVWEKEASEFDWTYDSTEQCYFLQGQAIVRTNEGDVKIQEGDFVTFPKGLSCVWKVETPVRKHYRFQ